MRETKSGLIMGPVLLRIGAFIFDWIAMLVIYLAIAAAIGLELEGGRPRTAAGAAVPLLTMSGYHIIFLALKSATPGKMMLNIYVAYPDGSPLRVDTAILRSLVLVVETIVGGVGLLISLVLMFVDPERRTLHDRIAGTMVLAGRAGAPLRAE